MKVTSADPMVETVIELLKDYVNNLGNDMINHRFVMGEALYGGRTEPFVYYYSPTNCANKAYYLDSTSLHPRVKRNKESPVRISEKCVKDEIPNIPDY